MYFYILPPYQSSPLRRRHFLDIDAAILARASCRHSQREMPAHLILHAIPTTKGATSTGLTISKIPGSRRQLARSHDAPASHRRRAVAVIARRHFAE